MHRGLDNYKSNCYFLDKIKERKEDNKVVFLDINGVIMPAPDPQIRHEHDNETLKEYLSKKYNDNIYMDMKGCDIGAVYYDWNHIATGYLRELLDKTGSNIVLSSNWRDGHPWEHLKAFFKLYDLDDYLIDRTPFNPTNETYICHEDSIKIYLNDHPEIKKYIVFDDIDYYKDFGENMRRIYHNGYGSISVTDYEYAMYVLNNNPQIEITNNIIKLDNLIEMHYSIIEESGYKLFYIDSIWCKYKTLDIDMYLSYMLAYIYKRMPEINEFILKNDNYKINNLGIGYKDSFGFYTISNTYDRDNTIYGIKKKLIKKD
jgi:hypothetical protein